MIYLKLKDLRTNKVFNKEFKSEYLKDMFKIKLCYSKHLVILYDSSDKYFID